MSALSYTLALIVMALLTMHSALASVDTVTKIVRVGPHPERIHVSRPTPTTWGVGERLCVMRAEHKLACGKVVRLDERSVLVALDYHELEAVRRNVKNAEGDWHVELTFRPIPLKRGTLAHRVGAGDVPISIGTQERKLASAEPATEIKSDTPAETPEEPSGPRARLDPRAMNAISAGMNFIFPTLHLRHMVTPHFSSGLMGAYLTYPVGDATIRGPGGFLSFSYYRDGPLSGLWVELAVGGYDLRAVLGDQIESFTAISASLIGGWRWRWRSGVTFGLGIGGQAIVGTKPALLASNPPTVLPSLMMDFGFAF